VAVAGSSASMSAKVARGGKFGTLSGSPAFTVSYGATAAKVVYPVTAGD
jgi:hypothetical protein